MKFSSSSSAVNLGGGHPLSLCGMIGGMTGGGGGTSPGTLFVITASSQRASTYEIGRATSCGPTSLPVSALQRGDEAGPIPHGRVYIYVCLRMS